MSNIKFHENQVVRDTFRSELKHFHFLQKGEKSIKFYTTGTQTSSKEHKAFFRMSGRLPWASRLGYWNKYITSNFNSAHVKFSWWRFLKSKGLGRLIWLTLPPTIKNFPNNDSNLKTGPDWSDLPPLSWWGSDWPAPWSWTSESPLSGSTVWCWQWETTHTSLWILLELSAHYPLGPFRLVEVEWPPVDYIHHHKFHKL